MTDSLYGFPPSQETVDGVGTGQSGNDPADTVTPSGSVRAVNGLSRLLKCHSVLLFWVEIFIQNCKTQEYLSADGWTRDLTRAIRFPSSLDATKHCDTGHIKHAQVLLRFGRKELDLTLSFAGDCN